MKITTDNKPRPAVCWYELPEKVQADFNYIREPHDPRFVKYRDEWYDACDAQRITTKEGGPTGWDMTVKPDDPLAKWHAIQSDSYFSGVLFRFDDQFGEGDGHIVVGRYCT